MFKRWSHPLVPALPVLTAGALRVACALCILAAMSEASGSERDVAAPAPAVVVSNAHLLTMSPARPEALALAVDARGRIVYIGDDEGAALEAAGDGARRIDVGGRVVVPGFNDAHVHFGLSMLLGARHGVAIAETTRRRWVRAVAQAAAARPGEAWLFVKTRRLPAGIRRSSDLDFVARPLMVVTARGGLLNHRALAAGRFSSDEAPDGFVRGRLLPAALERAGESLTAAEVRDSALDLLGRLARLGVTSVQLISDERADVFEALRAEGALTARVRLVPLGYRFETPLYDPPARLPAPEWVRIDGVKYFHDDDARMGRFELEEVALHALAAKRRVVLHVLSRGALRSFLDVMEDLEQAHPGAPRLLRVDHGDEASPEEARRLHHLGIMVCSNPSMLPEWRRAAAFPMRTLLDAGVRLCIGSDWVDGHLPSRPLDPMRVLELAATHAGFGTHERISARDALVAYTVGSAAAEGMERDKGSLEVGKLADLVVLSGDPTTTPAENISRIVVLLTMVGGRIVYTADAFAAPSAPPPPPAAGAYVPPSANVQRPRK